MMKNKMLKFILYLILFLTTVSCQAVAKPKKIVDKHAYKETIGEDGDEVITGTGNTTFQSVTAANSLVAGEGLRFDVDNAVSPETDEYSICFGVKYDRQ